MNELRWTRNWLIKFARTDPLDSSDLSVESRHSAFEQLGTGSQLGP